MRVERIVDDAPTPNKNNTSVISYTKEAVIERYEFPCGLSCSHRHESYLILSVLGVSNKYTSSSSHRKIRGDILNRSIIVNTLANIALPMPDNLEDKQTYDYGQGSSSVFAELGSKIINDFNTQGIGSDTVANVAKTGVKRGIEYLLKSDAATQVTGQRTLQTNIIMFRGTQLKEHTFRYRLRPKNSDELQEMNKLVQCIKKYAAPTHTKRLSPVIDDLSKVHDSVFSNTSSSTVNVPHLWSIEERIKPSNKPRFSSRFVLYPAVITDVTINKTPHQQYQTAAGTAGDAIEYEFSFTMKETIPHDSNFIDDVYSDSVRYRG